MSGLRARSRSPGHRWAVRSRICERTLGGLGYRCVAGLDEAGRGALAGPVVAAAVILPGEFSSDGIDDSKRLTPRQREQMYEVILAGAVAVGVGVVEHDEIDRLNILQATKRAMTDAVMALAPQPDFLLIDAVELSVTLPQWALIKGDQRVLSIAASSIIAKVTRDRLMVRHDRSYPDYRFALHKGYATPDHLSRLRTHGPCAIHRKSFRPVSDSQSVDGRAGAVRVDHGAHPAK